MDTFLFQAFIYLVAAVISVPVANRLGLGSVLGYLIAGVIIGPVLGLVGGSETQDLQTFAEFGVVMMLFLIGLELEPRALWAMRVRLLGMGGLQVVLTTGLITAAAMALGQPWTIALAIGLVFSLSSTAIVLQTLGEKGLMRTDGGRASFSVLLAQDIAVIPMLALIPLLAAPHLMDSAGAFGLSNIQHTAGGGGLNLLEGQPGWIVTLALIGTVGGIIVGGHYLTRPMFRFLALAKLPEIFTAAALLLVIGIALLMSLVGLSPALGTFLAGVVLANSEYRHELEADIEPFKGLLLGLFFITVGAGINFDILVDNFLGIIGMTLGMIAIKAGVLFGLARMFRLRGSAGWLFTLGMAQAGEFGFVLLSFTTQNDVIPGPLGATLSLVVTLSMLMTPGLFIFYDRIIAARVDPVDPEDEIDTTGTVIIAGLGRFGQIVNRMLLSHGHKTVVLDSHNELISGLRNFGVRAYFGDPSRPELLLAAGIKDASAIVIAIDDRDKSVAMVDFICREHPHVHIVARAFDRDHVYRLYAAGARDIVRETFDSSVRAGRYSLVALGHHPFEAEQAARVFVKQDRHDLAELARLWDPGLSALENEAYAEKAREINQRLNEAMMGLRTDAHDSAARSWMPPPKGGQPTDPDADP